MEFLLSLLPGVLSQLGVSTYELHGHMHSELAVASLSASSPGSCPFLENQYFPIPLKLMEQFLIVCKLESHIG